MIGTEKKQRLKGKEKPFQPCRIFDEALILKFWSVVSLSGERTVHSPGDPSLHFHNSAVT